MSKRMTIPRMLGNDCEGKPIVKGDWCTVQVTEHFSLIAGRHVRVVGPCPVFHHVPAGFVEVEIPTHMPLAGRYAASTAQLRRVNVDFAPSNT